MNARLGCIAVVAAWGWVTNGDVAAGAEPANLALWARPSTSYVSGHETLEAINDGHEPAGVNDHRHGAYGNWPRTGTQWVQYEWSQPVSTGRIDVYWWDDSRGVRLPKACRLLWWDGKDFVPVKDAAGLGVAGGRYNTTTFAEVTTSKLRLEFDGEAKSSTGILEWKVYDSGKSPKFPPRVSAGADRVVVLPGQAYLNGSAWGGPCELMWSKESGPGQVTFAAPRAAATTAKLSSPGEYVLALTASAGPLSSRATVAVTVEPPPPVGHLEAVEPPAYTLTSPFWRNRIKGQIIHWIPHCIRRLNDPKVPEGGVENFVQAGNKLAGRPHGKHIGAPWANAYVYNTLESMCLARMVDAAGDTEIAAAQEAMRKTIDDWVPKILAAQEPDGYLHTAYTLGGQRRWSSKGDHEGYNAGYLIEAALAHCLMSGGKDVRLLRAARRLADCWDSRIGPAPKQAWYDGHEGLEQALVRLAWFVDKREGPGAGRRYLELAKFLLDSRRGGETYDQSHLPVVEQAEAVGHAVRAVYLYSGMAGVAMGTGDPACHGAVKSLWSNLIHRKYYVTGGVGSGESSEGFGKDFSLPNGAYCESCSSCGQVFFQHKLQLIWRDARYADLYEETLYNALLGSVDLEGRNFTYTNPLDSSSARYLWHGCPCCVGNIPRTLLMLPTWMYSRSADSLYVNLYIGGAVTLDGPAGASVQVVQTTDYPWSGQVAIALHPAEPRQFTLKLRVPGRDVSRLYTSTPPREGLLSLKVNGQPVTPAVDSGYAAIARTWQRGDKIELVLPMKVHRITADSRVAATAGRAALRYGPLIYNIESKDQNVDSVLPPTAPLTVEWDAKLLDGVMVIRGAFADGQPLLAIPNYARLNRGGRSLVWIRQE